MLRTKAAHVRREISLNRYYREKKNLLLKSIYVIYIRFFSFAIIRHKVILQINHSKIETSILPFHQFHVITITIWYYVAKSSEEHFRMTFEAGLQVAVSDEMLGVLFRLKPWNV